MEVQAPPAEWTRLDKRVGPLRNRDGGMRWLVEFYNEKRGMLARYGVEAPLPVAAILLGRNAAFREVSTGSSATEAELVERAERVGGQDASGWVLYRIVNNRPGSTGVAPDDRSGGWDVHVPFQKAKARTRPASE